MRHTIPKYTLQWISQVHARLVKHVQQGTTDLALAAVVQSNRAGDVYFSSIRDKVPVEAAPSFILPSCLLPRGHVVVANLPSTQTSILIYRDATTNAVRAYQNRCRHRGAELIAPASATLTQPRRLKGSALVVCPYHSWTYHVGTGQLKRVPGETEGFPCLEKGGLSLQSLPCYEKVGGIWVGGDETLADYFSLDQMDEELSDLWLDPPTSSSNDDSLLVGFREWNLQANWQVLVETFLESYHVQYLHHNTLGQVTYGNRMVVDFYEDAGSSTTRSLRHTVPLTNFDPTPLVDNGRVLPNHPFFSQTTTTFFAFPNVAISIFKRFALMLSVIPTSNTSSRIQAFGITHQTANGSTMEKQHRDFESVVAGIQEDWDCAEGVQRGLTPDSMILHGRFEGNNHYFLHHVGKIAEKLLNRKDGSST
jgi:phenylpropionate dioxygenase-like ring-hydroxylating dioxygenase large terminal subunit